MKSKFITMLTIASLIGMMNLLSTSASAYEVQPTPKLTPEQCSAILTYLAQHHIPLTTPIDGTTIGQILSKLGCSLT